MFIMHSTCASWKVLPLFNNTKRGTVRRTDDKMVEENNYVNVITVITKLCNVHL